VFFRVSLEHQRGGAGDKAERGRQEKLREQIEQGALNIARLMPEAHPPEFCN